MKNSGSRRFSNYLKHFYKQIFCCTDESDSSDTSHTITDAGGSGQAATSGASNLPNSKNAKSSAEQKVSHNNNSKSKNGENSTTGSDKLQNGNTTNNFQKSKANCKPEELSKLKAKCEYLVRSCIGGLILSMTDQAFREMEGGLKTI